METRLRLYFKKNIFLSEIFYFSGAALRTAAVILFERYEQKDKSGWPDPAPLLGNAQLKNRLLDVQKDTGISCKESLSILIEHIF